MNKNDRKRHNGISSVFVLLIVAAVVYGTIQLWKRYQRYDIDKKYEFAMEQCEKYGGQQGNIPVFTEGVYDHRRAPTSTSIFKRAAVFLNNGLDYVEFSSEVVSVSISGVFESGAPYFRKGNQQFSFYRISISDRGDPRCKPYEDYIAAGGEVFEGAGLNELQCIAITGFDDPALLRAPYDLAVNDRVIDEGMPIEWNNLEIVSRESGDVVASFNTFSHCLTKMVRNRSEGFNYCSGIYANPKVRPKCPDSYAQSTLVITDFERAGFTYKRAK